MKKKFIWIFSIVFVVVAAIVMGFVFIPKTQNKINITFFYPIDNTTSTIKVEKGENFLSKVKPKEFEGYTFVGWYFDNDYKIKVTENSQFNASHTLKAAYAKDINLKTTNINLIKDKFVTITGGYINNEELGLILKNNVIYLNLENCTLNSDAKFSLESLETLVLPKNTTSLASDAFFNCYNLKQIENLENVTEIGDRVFYNCQKLEKVDLRAAKTLGEKVFEGSAIKCVSFGNNLTNIQDNTFVKSNIENISLEDSDLFFTLADGILYSNNFEKVIYVTKSAGKKLNFDQRVKEVAPYAFYMSDIDEVTFSSVDKIGKSAFENCKNLKSVRIENASNYQIEERAFCNCCNLSNINFGLGLSKIGKSAFENCYKLENVIFNNSTAENIANLSEVGSSSFKNCTSLKSFTLPDTVESFGSFALAGCTSLNKVVLSARLTNIEEKTFMDAKNLTSIVANGNIEIIGDYAFEGCINLNDIEDLFNATIVGIGAFKNCQNIERANFNSLQILNDDVFYGCIKLSEVSFDSLTTISNRALYQTAIKNFEISPNLQMFNESAFNESLLEQFSGESELFLVENGVLYNFSKNAIICYPLCKKDSTFTIKANILKIQSTNFYLNGNLKNITVEPGNLSFESQNGILYERGKETLLKFPNIDQEGVSVISEVKKINPLAFANNSKIKQLNLEGVTEIGLGALKNTKIQKLTIPFIGENLNDNKFLGYIFGAESYASNVEFIPQTLKDVVVTSEKKTISEYSFYGATSIETIEINKEVVSVEKYAFCNLDNLKEIKFNGSIASFDNYALSNLGLLANITLGYDQNIEIATNAIYNVSKNISVSVNCNNQTVSLQQRRQLKDVFKEVCGDSSNWKWFFV